MLQIDKYSVQSPPAASAAIRNCVSVWILLFASVALLVGASAYAQLDTGGITGTVTDPSGAVVPGAKITLTNEATGFAVLATSTSTGTYSLNAIRPGVYTLQAEAPGFQRFLARGVEVH